MRREGKKKKKKGALLSCKTAPHKSGSLDVSIPCLVPRGPVYLGSSRRRCQKSRARLQNSGACVPDREVSCVDKSSWKELTLPSDPMQACTSHWRRTLNWMEKEAGQLHRSTSSAARIPLYLITGLYTTISIRFLRKCTQTTQKEAAAAATECSQGGQGRLLIPCRFCASSSYFTLHEIRVTSKSDTKSFSYVRDASVQLIR